MPHPPPHRQGPDVVTADVELTMNGRRIPLRLGVPAGPVPPSALLPLYRGLADHLTNLAVAAANSAGHAISCQKGCGACCRQLVPVSPLEARELVKIVERMPEPRRSAVKLRFADARRRLGAEAPGLLERLLRSSGLTRDDAVALGHEYFRLRIACPFLEEESCSIYAELPVDCRQYLVVSPARHCAEDASPHVRALSPWGGSISGAIPAAANENHHAAEWVHLLLAPDFVAAHPHEPPERPGPEMVEAFFDRFGQPPRPDQPKTVSQPENRS